MQGADYMHIRVQEKDTFYVGGDRCTWSIQPQGMNKQKFSFHVDTSGMGPNSSVSLYNSNFANFEDDEATKTYAGYSNMIRNDLELDGIPIRVTFIASSEAPPASGPRIWFRQVRAKEGMSAHITRLAVLIGLSLLFGFQVLLSVLAWRRYQRSALEARHAEELAARCCCPCSPPVTTEMKLSKDMMLHVLDGVLSVDRNVLLHLLHLSYCLLPSTWKRLQAASNATPFMARSLGEECAADQSTQLC
jgi:hypothetical protein